MKTLIIVHSPTWFTELSLLGRHIHDQPGEEVVFHIIDYGHWTMHDFAAGLRADGIPCHLEAEEGPPRLVPPRRAPTDAPGGGEGGRVPAAGAPADAAPRSGGLKGRAAAWLRRHGPPEGHDFLAEHAALAGAIADARALAARHQPDIVVIGGNNPGYSTAALIKGFRQCGLKTIIVSSTMSNGLEEAEVYSTDRRYHIDRWPARLVARLFPRWLIEHRGQRLLRCPPGRVLAMEAHGLAPPRPWVFNSGHAEALAMESAAMIDYYVEAGLPRDNMVLTGSPSDDVMARQLRDAPRLKIELLAELGLPPDRPLLLTALPPDFLYVEGGRPQCDFRHYRDLVTFWMRALTEQDRYAVVVALHPSVKVEDMRWIEETGARIAARRTATLVPLCDVYVASISSTIRWAIACAKPVINYDVYRYRYTDYQKVPAVLATEEQDAFRALIRRLAEDDGHVAQLQAAQAAEAPRWGTLDGQSAARIHALLRRHGRERGRGGA